MSMPWQTFTPATTVARRWWDGPGFGPEPAGHSWWDGSTLHPANLLGWWDGVLIQPAALAGYYDGVGITPL